MKSRTKAAREGMSIVCVTHTLANLPEYCDDLVVLAGGGHLAFHGSVAGALQHFRAATLGEVLGELNDGPVKAWPAAVPDAPARSPGAAALQLEVGKRVRAAHLSCQDPSRGLSLRSPAG